MAKQKAKFLKEVEIDGHAFHVDMSRLRSKEFVRNAMKVQQTQDTDLQLQMFDMLFEGETGAEVEAYIVEAVGYADYVKILEIEGRIVEAADLKN